MPGKHAIHSPSASTRWLGCQGSLIFTENDPPPDDETVYSREGTIGHEVAATCLKENKSPGEYLNKTIEGVTITQELVDAIQVYIDEIHGKAAELKVSGGKVEHEVYVTDDCWGTADAILYNSETLYVGDLKLGKGVIVQAEENTQLLIYAVGALLELATKEKIKPSKCILAILQPRTVNPIREWEIDTTKVMGWYEAVLKPQLAYHTDLRERVYPHIPEHLTGRERMLAVDAKMQEVLGYGIEHVCQPSDDACRWCPIACAKRAKHYADAAAEAFQDFIPKPEGEAAKQALEESGPVLDNTALGKLLAIFPGMKKWIASIESEAMGEALGGNSIPGFKLVAGRSNRRWAWSENEVVDWLRTAGVAPYDQKLRTLTSVEKELGKKKRDELGFEKLWEKPEGKPTLVPESDKRPAIMGEEEVEVAMADFVPAPETTRTGNVSPLPTTNDPFAALDNLINTRKQEEAVSETVEMETGEVVEVMVDPQVPATSVGDSDRNPIQIVNAGEEQNPPNTNTKMYTVLMRGSAPGGALINDVATELSTTPNSVKMLLRYLNERNGYGYTLYSDGGYVVTMKGA